MHSGTLTKELVSDTSMWRMAMELTSGEIAVMAYCPMGDTQMIHRRIPLEGPAADSLPAIEETIYANPLLLGDFKTTDILIDTPRMMLAPVSELDENTATLLTAELWGQGQLTTISSPLPLTDMAMLMATDTPLLTFLRRTFPTANVCHRLSPMITYFASKSRLSSTPRLYANLRGGTTDIICLRGTKILLANTFETPETADSMYYLTAVADTCGFDPDEGEIMVSGDKDLRAALTAELRKSGAKVMPVLFPPTMYDAGAATSDLPFELILLPLCV